MIKIGDRVSIDLKILDQTHTGTIVKITDCVTEDKPYVFVKLDDDELGMAIAPAENCKVINNG